MKCQWRTVERKRSFALLCAHTLLATDGAYDPESTRHAVGHRARCDRRHLNRCSAQDITSKDLLDGLANPSRWLTYSGDYTGQRFSPLTQITPANVGQLAAQWTFQTGVVNKFEATPIVIDGMLYVTGALESRVGDRRTHRQADLALPAHAAAGAEGLLRPGQPRLRRLSAIGCSW